MAKSTDRELLEWAAKAAGIVWYGYAGDDECECRYFDIGEEDVVEWNPLTDDGDALRLAVKLHFNIHWDELCKDWKVYKGSTLFSYNADLRRAIVRAAAEIGKAMP